MSDRSGGRGWRAWLLALLAIAAVTAALVPFRGRLDKAHVALVYLLVVLGGSALGGRRVGLALGGGAFLLFNFLFLRPYYTLTIADPLDWLVLIAFLATSIVAAELLDRQRRQGALAEQRRLELDQLSTLGAETLNAARAEHALGAIARVIQSSVGVARCELFVRQDGNTLRAIADTRTSPTPNTADREDLLRYIVESGQAAIAHPDGTVHVTAEHAGNGEGAVTTVTAFAIPLTVRGQTVGALRVSSEQPFSLTAEQHRILGALAYYAALGIDRLRLERTEEAAEELRRVDRLKDALLAAVSHDLRTPLTTIKGIAHEIAASGTPRASIIEDEADQLSGLVEGLLELSQLNAGALPIRREINTVDDLIGAALQRAGAAVGTHPVEVDVGANALLIGTFDFVHSLRILVNLLENAAKYSPLGAPITIAARRRGDRIEVAVADRGPGIPPFEAQRIFEPFYRSPGAPADVRGAGLGLSIARRLAEAQGGSLAVEPRDGGGSVFTMVLPAGDIPTR